jgi:hypothetical protein|tara:strand:- start:28 stop:444 length:417 start_codon:yes stop_codon:yes gene_type:complete
MESFISNDKYTFENLDCNRNYYISRVAPKTERKGGTRGMRFTYARSPKEHFEYALKTDPPDAMYWTTYRLKKSDITLIDKFNRAMTADIKQEIFDDIISCEPNPSKKSTPPEDEISKRRQARKPIYVETGKTKQKTRR